MNLMLVVLYDSTELFLQEKDFFVELFSDFIYLFLAFFFFSSSSLYSLF